MSSVFEMVKDLKGNNHIIRENSSLYDDNKMGENLSDFEILQVLNEENNSFFVSKVRSLNNNKIYAMKSIGLRKIGDKLDKYMEVMTQLKQLNNPHIIKYYKTFKDDQNLYLIMEYMNNSDINGFIKAHQILDKNIKEEVIWNILLQCLSAIEYLYQQNSDKYGIRLSNIFISNEQNAKIGVFSNISHSPNNWGEDINLLGKYLYIMCYSQTSELKKYDKFIPLNGINYSERSSKEYSEELMKIIYKMIDEKFNSTTIFNEVKKIYENKYPRTSSIEAVLRCLYSYSNMNSVILEKAEETRKNKENKYINYWYLEAISALSGENEHNLTECIEELRHAIESENSKLDGSREIEPPYILSFLLEKMHKELNKVDESKAVPNQIGHYVINSTFNEEEEDKENQVQMKQKFDNFFRVNVNSIISNLFFGILQTTRECQNCKKENYSFNNFCFAAFDLDKTRKQNFDLKNDGFALKLDNQLKKKFEPDSPDRVFCERCMTYQLHLENNSYYKISQQLVISLLRGNNFQNNTKVDFPEELDLSDVVKDKNNISCRYNLVGAINRLDSKGKVEFIYWARDPNQRNSWHTNNGFLKNQNTPINEIQSKGQVILLFYDSINNIPNNWNYNSLN